MTSHFMYHFLDELTDPEDGGGYFWLEPKADYLGFSDGAVSFEDLKAIIDRAIESYDAELLDEAFDRHAIWEAGWVAGHDDRSADDGTITPNPYEEEPA